MKSPATADYRICFVGDSFVQGAGDPLCLGWVGRLAQHAIVSGIALTHYNLGIRRDTSRDIAARWLQECTPRLPDSSENRLVFSFGVNDTVMENGQRRIPEEESVENFCAILEKAAARFPFLVIGPPPLPDDAHNIRIEALDHRFALAAATRGIPYLSVFEPLKTDEHWLTEAGDNDGAHPHRLGYDRLAALVHAWDRWWFT
ncbi:MAG TPA: GDSL-type esterase/lipase family protein [Oxalicibacterium sp.]|nr:GDSL-type esterase/lipase family protein [Oxalicibacterium sp.]